MASTENIDYKSIGARIKTDRLKKDFTQPELAELLDVSTEYISRLERASSHPGLPMLAEIAKVLDVSLSYIIEGTTISAGIYILLNPVNSDHAFRSYPATQSGRIRPAIPVGFGHLMRMVSV